MIWKEAAVNWVKAKTEQKKFIVVIKEIFILLIF